MLNNFIYTQSKALFEQQLEAGNILDEAIVFIEDTKEIWNHGTYFIGNENKPLSITTSSAITLFPNIYYRNTNTALSSLTITLGFERDQNVLNEYFIEFTTSNSGTSVSLPSSVKWVNGEAPELEDGCTYQISIVNNLGTCVKFC